MSRSLSYRVVPAEPEAGDLPYELIWLLENAFEDPFVGRDPLDLELDKSDLRALRILSLDRPVPLVSALNELIEAISNSPSGKVRVWTHR